MRLLRAASVAALAVATTAAADPSAAVCDPAGLARSPPVCFQLQPQQTELRQTAPAAVPAGGAASAANASHLPNIFGGPATLGQCVYGHFGGQQSNYGGGASCWTGALFGFSGVDGAILHTQVESLLTFLLRFTHVWRHFSARRPDLGRV